MSVATSYLAADVKHSDSPPSLPLFSFYTYMLVHHLAWGLCTVQNRKLEYEQQRLEKEVADMQEAFDAALALLSREKLSLEADVKAADIKRLTYQQEMQLLKVICVCVSKQTSKCPLPHLLFVFCCSASQKQQGCLRMSTLNVLVASHRNHQLLSGKVSTVQEPCKDLCVRAFIVAGRNQNCTISRRYSVPATDVTCITA